MIILVNTDIVVVYHNWQCFLFFSHSSLVLWMFFFWSLSQDYWNDHLTHYKQKQSNRGGGDKKKKRSSCDDPTYKSQLYYDRQHQLQQPYQPANRRNRGNSLAAATAEKFIRLCTISMCFVFLQHQPEKKIIFTTFSYHSDYTQQ